MLPDTGTNIEQPKQTGEINPPRVLLEDKMNWMWGIVIAILIVLFVAFIATILSIGGFIQSYLASRTATYQSLVDKITEQNVKINLLYDSLDKANTELNQTNSDLVKLKTYFGIK